MGNGHGSVYLRANLWTIDFTINGRRVREGIGTNRRQAEMVLAKRMSEAIEGRYFNKRNLGLMPFKEFADKYLEEVIPPHEVGTLGRYPSPTLGTGPGIQTGGRDHPSRARDMATRDPAQMQTGNRQSRVGATSSHA